jgi:hypothetical protein
MIYYTYAYLREDRTPYYIGKGQGNRAYKRCKTDIKPPKDKTRILILKKNLTEEESFKHEIYMIAVFGRKDLGTGILHNRTNGGEGSSGAILSEEHKRKISEKLKGRIHSKKSKKKMSESQRGENNPMYGKNLSDETKRKISEAQKGKTVSGETKRKMSEAQKGEKHHYYGKTLSEEHKNKLSVSLKGENNPMYGRTHSEETKKKMSEMRKNPSEETRKKLSEARKATKWWNNGQMTKKVIECPGDDWVPGRKCDT